VAGSCKQICAFNVGGLSPSSESVRLEVKPGFVTTVREVEEAAYSSLVPTSARMSTSSVSQREVPVGAPQSALVQEQGTTEEARSEPPSS
jgi:hypothetical protein